MGRAERRKNKARMKKKAARVYSDDPDGGITLADHLAWCSCMGCGNQRQHEGSPMREKRQPDVDDFDDEIIEEV